MVQWLMKLRAGPVALFLFFVVVIVSLARGGKANEATSPAAAVVEHSKHAQAAVEVSVSVSLLL